MDKFFSKKKACHVKMSLTRGQYAWFSFFERISKHNDHSYACFKQIVEFFSKKIRKPSETTRRGTFRLDGYWLVVLTNGHGNFSIDRQIKPNGHIVWNLVFPK